MNIQAEMPRYKSHKKVWALKIRKIEFDHVLARLEIRETDGSAIITPEEEGYAPFKVNNAYWKKHNPQVGGYYVQYEGGYESFSPADAFEDGYILIRDEKEGPLMPDGIETRADYIEYILTIHSILPSEAIILNAHEIQSRFSRVRHAQGLIMQLDKNHDGRNTWLLNYGINEESIAKRKKRDLEFVENTQSCELS